MNKDYNPDDYKKEHKPKIALGENLKIEVPIRRVMYWGEKGYGVAEFKNVSHNLWVHVGEFYEDVNDAYTALGMMTQRLVINNIPEKYMKGMESTVIPPKLTKTVTRFERLDDGTFKEIEEQEEII